MPDTTPREKWISDRIGASWLKDEYPEGTVAGVMFDAWMRSLGPQAADDHLREIGEPREEELWRAADVAGVLKWEAYPPGEVDRREEALEEEHHYDMLEAGERD